MPYLPMSKNHYCIDIPSSPLYNQIVDISKYPKAMSKGTTEPMRRDLAAKPDDSYRRGLFIDHNPRNQPGAGSCIFMHQIVPEKTATAGCTALPDADLTAIFAWLKPELQPVYLLLPAAEYQALRASWHLPVLQP
jgi:L,D-peptidoglycan transpeptidase YkuD (ErfK/YbiS/YcfS/YnhG family)